MGSTKNTVSLIKNNNYWNSSNLTPKDPVVSSLCSQIDIKNAVEKANLKVAKEKKKIDKNFFPQDLLKLMEENSTFYFGSKTTN